MRLFKKSRSLIKKINIFQVLKMKKLINRKIIIISFLEILNLVSQPTKGIAQTSKDSTTTNITQSPVERDSQHDFDFEIGVWKTHLKRLTNPLSGSAGVWVEYDGTTM